MSDTLEQVLQQAGPAAPPAAPSEPAREGGPGDAAPFQPEGSPAPAAQPEADELPESVREYLAANPQHREIADRLNRDLQRGITPKLQEAAELRKLMDGIDPRDIQTLRQIQAASRENPSLVRQQLIDYANTLAPREPSAPDSYANVSASTPAEELFLKEAMESRKWREEQERQSAEARLQQFAAHASSEFVRLAAEHQVTIPVDVQIAAAKHAQSTGMGVEQALFAVHGRAILDAATRRARDEAAGIVQTKAAGAAGNPGAIVPRSSPTENTKRDFKSIFAQELQELGST